MAASPLPGKARSNRRKWHPSIRTRIAAGSMTPERWQQVEDLYHAAYARPAGERAAFLDEACRGDEALRRDVESLLNDSSRDEFLAAPSLQTTTHVGAPAPPDLTGHSLGGYRLEALLGAGGMGEVYRSRDEKLGRDVAIKILPREFTSHPDRLARFEREARMLAALSQPNICAIYGFERSGRRSLPGSRAGRRRHAGRQACARGACTRRQRRPATRLRTGHRAANHRRARSRPRQRHRSPRPEAGQHQDHAGRRRQGARLRSRQGRERRRVFA